MLNYNGGQSIRASQLHMNSSTDDMAGPRLVSELGEEGTISAPEFGFAEGNLAIPAVADSDYKVSSSVAGFAPAIADYFDEIAEAGFPNVQTSAYIFGKRAFDIVFSLTAIVMTLPLMLLIAIAIKISSRGPVFFRQERIGSGGMLFEMLKFRTMRVADKAFTDTAWRANDDPRRTFIGHVLRRTSLDELPQFFNVLLGEMSVVGPRPERPFFVEKFCEEISHYNLRHKGEVGITGLAQVRGFRGDTSIHRRVVCDLEYLEHWSFKLDAEIIWRTIRRMFVSDHE